MALWKRKKKVSDDTAAISESSVKDNEAVEMPVGDGFAVNEAEVIDWRERYNSEHEAFERFRREIRYADEKRRKEESYRILLSECGIPEKHRDKLTRLCDMDSLQVSDDGKIVGEADLKAAISKDWCELIPKPNIPVVNPPMYRGQAVTKESIMAIKDRDERRAAIKDNLDLFI